MPTTGDRIREIRDKRKLTLDRLAQATKISKGFLSDVENNKANVSSQLLLKIANVLGASVDYILRGETKATSSLNEPIVIPPELSLAAEQLQLTYGETLELLEEHKSVVARRSNKTLKPFSVEDWKELHKALKRVFG